jgi:haloacetate dehalogenase
VDRLAVLDIVPTQDVWQMADARLVTAFWPWSLLAQPEPLPERLLSAAPDAVIDDALTTWSSPAGVFDAEVREAYVRALSNPASIHAICEEYRAAATVDREHDAEDRLAGRRIACPVLALWSDRGPLAQWYSEVGGPVGIWRAWADDVRGLAVAAGHFFPEEIPEETAAALSSFFRETR